MASKGLKKLANKVKKEIREINKPLEEVFIETIDNYLVESRQERDNEKENSISIKPSSYYKCIRKLWYELLGFPKKQKWYPRSIRILENGTVLHEWIQKQVFMDMDKGDYDIKLIPETEFPAFGKPGIEFIKDHNAPEMEIKFRDMRFTKQYPISAMVDGAIEFRNLQMILEFKTIKPKDFELLFEPLKEHIKQGAIYALCTGIRRVMFLYYDKGEHHFKAFLVEYNDAQIEWARLRIQKIEEYLLNLELPPKEEGKDCDFCPFKDFCEREVAGKEFSKNEYGFNYVIVVE